MNLLTVADRAALTAYCEAWALWVDAKNRVREDQKRGEAVGANTRFMIQMFKEMRAYLTEFGLTPSSRTRMGTPIPPAQQDPLEAFLNDDEPEQQQA
jgi:P27 family predicted phage terminase small subunit